MQLWFFKDIWHSQLRKDISIRYVGLHGNMWVTIDGTIDNFSSCLVWFLTKEGSVPIRAVPNNRMMYKRWSRFCQKAKFEWKLATSIWTGDVISFHQIHTKWLVSCSSFWGGGGWGGVHQFLCFPWCSSLVVVSFKDGDSIGLCSLCCLLSTGLVVAFSDWCVARKILHNSYFCVILAWVSLWPMTLLPSPVWHDWWWLRVVVSRLS